ncbi:MAG: hypothetical protein E6579_02355 [Clostridium sp.]|nr:hypothetical protein [Clostridium sp.]MDU6345831.1 hypothetical protein [Clostridium sp.]
MNQTMKVLAAACSCSFMVFSYLCFLGFGNGFRAGDPAGMMKK